jgi:hypothetical protein
MGPPGYDPIDVKPGSSTGHPYPPDHHSDDSMSIPLNDLHSSSNLRPDIRPIHMPDGYDPERAAGGMPDPKGASWDLLSGIKNFEHSYQEFDPARNASESHLAFADGDVPKNQASPKCRTFASN